ncbi:unnamed protein product [Caenorhabditis angaria]|uniref:BED-type domain-containing protein n=1 Tax=Caenorhabditis angaria TaxID=860376 RepID=A0A9P1IJJ5_9PELO|nr:unnamed protein product [Caenorhabditis angaria]
MSENLEEKEVDRAETSEHPQWKKPGKSLIWKYFERIDNNSRLRCKLCSKIYMPSKTKSTSTQLNHLRHQHKIFNLLEETVENRSSTSTEIPTPTQNYEDPVQFLPNEEKFSEQFGLNDFNLWNREVSSSPSLDIPPKEDNRIRVLTDLVRQQSLLLLQNGHEAKFQKFWSQVISAVAESNT